MFCIFKYTPFNFSCQTSPLRNCRTGIGLSHIPQTQSYTICYTIQSILGGEMSFPFLFVFLHQQAQQLHKWDVPSEKQGKSTVTLIATHTNT